MPAVFMVPMILETELRQTAVPWPPDYLFWLGCSIPDDADVYRGGIFVSWHRVHRGAPRLQTGFDVEKFGAICVAVLGVLAFFVNIAVESKMAQWSRVRTLIDQPGLVLSREPRPAVRRCRPQARFCLLPAPWSKRCSSAEHARADWTLSADDPGPHGSFVIAKVKVPDGPSAQQALRDGCSNMA